MKVSGQQLNYTLLYGNAYNPAATPSELSGSAELEFLSVQYVCTVSLCDHISLVCGWKWLIMQGVVKKEQMVLKIGWVEVNDAITVMDYTESEDAVLYHLRAGALCSLKEKEKTTACLSLSSSVCVPSISVSHPALISFSTSSSSCALLLTDCQWCLANRNHNFLLTL